MGLAKLLPKIRNKLKRIFIFCRAVCSLGGPEASFVAGGPSFVIVKEFQAVKFSS